jgi:serine/threonine protein kinase
LRADEHAQRLQEQGDERLGDYRLVKELARGGMAVVSLAYQTTSLGLERRVVIKSVLPHMVNQQEFVTMFIDEARLMMSFSHPHIAQVFEAGQLEGRHFIAMEYINGATLSSLIRATQKRKEHIPYEVAFGVALALGEALSYVHQRCDEFGNWLSIIHRDLKPSNVLIRPDGVVKLIDFGIAQAASKQHQTKTGVLKGTIGYLAPEQILGEAVDQRADVFTLGLLLYQIFLGRYPFPGKNDAQRLRSLLDGAPLSPERCRPGCPPQLSELLLKSLASNPQERLQMSELVEGLAACARTMQLTPHFRVIGAWVREHMDPAPQGKNRGSFGSDRELSPAIESLRASTSVSAQEGVTAINPHPPQAREALINAKLDDLDPLLDGDTLFDSELRLQWGSEGSEGSKPRVLPDTRVMPTPSTTEAPPSPPHKSDPFLATDEDMHYTQIIERDRLKREGSSRVAQGRVSLDARSSFLTSFTHHLSAHPRLALLYAITLALLALAGIVRLAYQ